MWIKKAPIGFKGVTLCMGMVLCFGGIAVFAIQLPRAKAGLCGFISALDASRKDFWN
jgi:hypothetical protein